MSTHGLSFVAADRSEPVLQHTIGDALRIAADNWGERIALQEGNAMPGARRWTFRALLAEAEQVAGALLQRFPPANTWPSARQIVRNGY
jgi:fatty-acyl-CoA synthase